MVRAFGVQPMVVLLRLLHKYFATQWGLPAGLGRSRATYVGLHGSFDFG